jgi:hypothetical protein
MCSTSMRRAASAGPMATVLWEEYIDDSVDTLIQLCDNNDISIVNILSILHIAKCHLSICYARLTRGFMSIIQAHFTVCSLKRPKRKFLRLRAFRIT